MSFELPEVVLTAGEAVMEAQGVAPRREDAVAAAAGPEVAPEEPRDPFALPGPKGDDFGVSFSRTAAGSTDSVTALAELSAGLVGLDAGDAGTGFGGDDAAGFQDFEAGEDAFGGDQLVAGFGGEAFGGGFDGLALEESVAARPDAATSGHALALALAAGTGPAVGLGHGPDGASPKEGKEGGFAENGVLAAVGAGSAADGMSGTVSTRLPVLWVVEQVYAEFHGGLLHKVGLQGDLRMQPPFRKMAAGSEGTVELGFRLDGAAGVQTTAVNKQLTARVGPGLFHARIPPSAVAGPTSPLVLTKYHLAAHATPLPLRLHLVTRRGPDGRVAVLLQYVANPALLGPLHKVLFIISLPFTPDSVRFSPRGVWVKKERQLRWTVPTVIPGGPPGRLRVILSGVARQQSMAALCARVVAGSPGYLLSAMYLRPAVEGGSPPFLPGEHSWSTGMYVAYPADRAASVLGNEFSLPDEPLAASTPHEERRQDMSMDLGDHLAGSSDEKKSMKEGGGQNSTFVDHPELEASNGYDDAGSVSTERQKVERFDSFGFDAFGDEPNHRQQEGLIRQQSSAFDSPKQTVKSVPESSTSTLPFNNKSLNFF